MVKIYTDLAGESLQFYLGLQIFFSTCGWLGAVDYSEFVEASQDMLVQDGVSLQADISEEMAGFLVADTFYPFAGGEESPQL